MGHRANYVIVEQGEHRIHYSQFGALSLASAPLTGPEGLRSFILSTERRDQPTDDVWCEGSLVLDLDARTLLFWSEHCPAGVNLEVRRALLRLVGERWPEWNIRWAVRGHADVLAYLGLDAEGLIAVPEPAEELTVDQVTATLNQGTLLMGARTSLQDQRRQITEGDPDPYYLDAETILTVRFSDGQVRDFSTLWSIDRVMTVGADLVTALRSAPGTTLPRVEHVRGGALIDVAARTVTAWPLPHPGPGAAEHWPGWRVTWSDLGLPGQVAATGRDPAAVAQTPAHLVREAADLVGAADRVTQVQQSLLEDLADLRAAGAEIVKEFRPTRFPSEPADERAELLARLVELRRAGAPG
ncbi:hypothetical protein OG417_18825 [Actinoallomurus sp. NBC_01490]|jgi:hypothetical protein|uniref:hypothetical protein n=1 Tax=Actinoallomurus sp. NBC_01490 TaxID=2903557 RepID=UPI002E309676|nr:hypothetical protein [Actinoallomurus sp. NBC_01490]